MKNVNKYMMLCFFHDEDYNKFVCKNCTKCILQNIKGGYSNLKCHNEIYNKNNKKDGLKIEHYAYYVYAWIEWVIMYNIPLVQLDKALTKNLVEGKEKYYK